MTVRYFLLDVISISSDHGPADALARHFNGMQPVVPVSGPRLFVFIK